MNTIPGDLQRRLLFLLHRAWVEARLLAIGQKTQQVQDLADAFEQLPGWLSAWQPEYLDHLRENLTLYRSKYPESFEYIDFIDKHEPPVY